MPIVKVSRGSTQWDVHLPTKLPGCGKARPKTKGWPFQKFDMYIGTGSKLVAKCEVCPTKDMREEVEHVALAAARDKWGKKK